MKTMKYFMMGALLFGCSVGTMAQDGSSADVDALKSLIKSKPADYHSSRQRILLTQRNVLTRLCH